jgi:hypothetical protein
MMANTLLRGYTSVSGARIMFVKTSDILTEISRLTDHA